MFTDRFDIKTACNKSLLSAAGLKYTANIISQFNMLQNQVN